MKRGIATKLGNTQTSGFREKARRRAEDSLFGICTIIQNAPSEKK